MPPPFLYLKHLQAIDPSFETITKPLSNRSRIEINVETFRDNGQKDFAKPFISSKSSKHFIIELAQENP